MNTEALRVLAAAGMTVTIPDSDHPIKIFADLDNGIVYLTIGDGVATFLGTEAHAIASLLAMFGDLVGDDT